MPHTAPLIATLVAGLGLAFILGTIANRLRISPLVGYLLAGVAVGPFTPGFVADQSLAPQLAEIGVILLMFGIGLHFSLKDLLSLRAIAVPGAVMQVAASGLLGIGLARLLGWSGAGGFVFGVALSIASTVVVMRSLQERRLVETERGHIAVGWLIVQDLLMVVVLVLLPPIAAVFGPEAGPVDLGTLAANLGITLGKVAVFVGLTLLVGRRAIPALLHFVAHTGSRELFRLAVLSVALGIALAASELFGVSFALGAFFAGMTLSESELSQQAAEESLPLRDAFAVLFFVSVGMLFDPEVLVAEPRPILGALLLVLIGNPCIAFIAVRILGGATEAAVLVAVGLAQIGEFSFILADLGVGLGILSERARHLILATAIVSILVNPIVLALPGWIGARWRRPAMPSAAPASVATATEEALPRTDLSRHAVLVGYGRVGQLVGPALRERGWPVLVIEDATDAVEQLRAAAIPVVQGNAADDRVLAAANLGAARLLLVAIPNAFEAGQIVEQARAANPNIEIVARAHFDAEVDHLMQHGANAVIMGEREIARSMLEHAAATPVPAG